MGCDGLTGRCKLMWGVGDHGVRRLPTARPNSRETPGAANGAAAYSGATAVAPVPELAKGAVDFRLL